MTGRIADGRGESPEPGDSPQGVHSVEMMNNLSERQIKQLVIGRKNWMFAGSENGARNAAILFSLVVSCKLAGVDPFAYFRDILTRLPNHPADRVEELIPREWKTRFGPASSPVANAA
jgi:transposase